MKLRLLILSMFFLLTACSNNGDTDHVLTLKQLKPLETIALVMKGQNANAMIDLRDQPIRFVPEGLRDLVSSHEVEALKAANIQFVANDPSLGGVLFETETIGIAISGTSKGYLYEVQPQVNLHVADIASAFEERKASIGSDTSLNVQLLQVLENPWALYLESY